MPSTGETIGEVEKDAKKRQEKKKNNKPKKVKPIWKLEELDYGNISRFVKVSPDGNKIIYSKFGYSKNQSLTWDIHLIELDSKSKKRLTHSKRANNACWSPDSKKIAYVSHKNSTSNLFSISEFRVTYLDLPVPIRA